MALRLLGGSTTEGVTSDFTLARGLTNKGVMSGVKLAEGSIEASSSKTMHTILEKKFVYVNIMFKFYYPNYVFEISNYITQTILIHTS